MALTSYDMIPELVKYHGILRQRYEYSMLYSYQALPSKQTIPVYLIGANFTSVLYSQYCTRTKPYPQGKPYQYTSSIPHRCKLHKVLCTWSQTTEQYSYHAYYLFRYLLYDDTLLSYGGSLSYAAVSYIRHTSNYNMILLLLLQ